MGRQRLKDGLVGAAVAVLVLVLAGVLALWSVTDPAGEPGSGAEPAATGGTGGGGADGDGGAEGEVRTEPPTDLEPGELWLGDLVLDAGLVASADGGLRDVRAIGTDVRTGPDGLLAGRLAVDATVPFELVAEQVGEGVVVRAGSDGHAAVERTLEIAGRELDVVAEGTVEVVRGDLVIRPTSVDVGGPSFVSGLVSAAARRLVTIRHRIDGLPEGLVLRDVQVQEDGFRAELSGRDVRLAATGATSLIP